MFLKAKLIDLQPIYLIEIS